MLYNQQASPQMPYFQQMQSQIPAQYMPQYNRLTQLEQTQAQYPSYVSAPNIIKGRPVSSLEEARASQIDLDGSLFVFTDIGHKKIYTKQLGLDGTSSMLTYTLVEESSLADSYVTQSEFEKFVSSFRQELDSIKEINIKSVRGSITDEQSVQQSTTGQQVAIPKQSSF